MPDLKILIAGRSFNISCNPGEEIAATESANLLDQEAELLQTQLGRLPEEKMLLLSGLLLGDKIRALRHERNTLEETLRVTQSELNRINSKVEVSEPIPSAHLSKEKRTIDVEEEDNKIKSLQNISNFLDDVIKEIERPSLIESKERTKADFKKDIQDSFL